MKKDVVHYSDKDVSLSAVVRSRIGVIGYGNQGRAQALNLHDSGVEVRVGLMPGSPSFKKAEDDGIQAASIPSVTRWADTVVLLIPDQVMAEVYRNHVAPGLKEGSLLIFAHGYNIHYNLITPAPELDVALVAPSGPGRLLRERYSSGSGLPCLVAVHRNPSGKALDKALAYAKAIGCTRVGAFLTTFARETEADLFGEQAILAGGIPQLIRTAFYALTDAGYEPEIAWLVCFYEVKMITDLFHRTGFAGMYEAISDTAEYGGKTRGAFLIDKNLRVKMDVMIDDIRSGEFFKEFSEEIEKGSPVLKSGRKKDEDDLFEQTTRKMLSILDER